jgi:hypothetical protein
MLLEEDEDGDDEEQRKGRSFSWVVLQGKKMRLC